MNGKASVGTALALLLPTGSRLRRALAARHRRPGSKMRATQIRHRTRSSPALARILERRSGHRNEQGGAAMLKFLGTTMGIIFLIGLLVVIGLIALIL